MDSRSGGPVDSTCSVRNTLHVASNLVLVWAQGAPCYVKTPVTSRCLCVARTPPEVAVDDLRHRDEHTLHASVARHRRVLYCLITRKT